MGEKEWRDFQPQPKLDKLMPAEWYFESSEKKSGAVRHEGTARRSRSTPALGGQRISGMRKSRLDHRETHDGTKRRAGRRGGPGGDQIAAGLACIVDDRLNPTTNRLAVWWCSAERAAYRSLGAGRHVPVPCQIGSGAAG